MKVVVLLASLAACGVGNQSPLPGPAVVPVNAVTGVAATGAPIFGTVTLKDASTPAQELTTATASDGTFIFDTAGLTAPFLLRSQVGTHSYYSMATSGTGVTNINPLTTVVVSVAAGGTDLGTLYIDWSSSTSESVMLGLPSADAAVQDALGPVFSQFGVSGSILNSTYVADHTGIDAILDVVTIAVSAGPAAVVTVTNKSSASTIYTAPSGSFGSGTIDAANIPDVPVQSLGAILYRTNCTSCHGDIYNSSIIGRSTVAQIMGAIVSDFGGMSALGALTPQEIQAISDAIPAQATPITPGTLDGPTLYANNCASCHGELANSAKTGITIVRLQNAISGNVGNMGRLSTLDPIDMEAIVVALNATTSPPLTLDGATIYASNCAGCHNPQATSTKTGLTVSRFYAAVTNNSATGMEYLATLSLAEVQALIAVLPAPVTPGATGGQLLYETNCASCHGAFDSSAKAGATAQRINSAISANTGGMGALSSLSSQDVADIVTALGTVVVAPPPPGTPPGQTLYTTFCASCHGAFAESTKAGPAMTAQRIQAGIAANPTQMGALDTTLSAQDISDIATALAALPAPVLDGPGLYAANCQGCHGALSSSTKGGATAAKIQQEITNNRAGVMGAANLAALTSSEIDLIAAALSSVAPPQCGSCHAVALASLTSGRHRTHTTAPNSTDLAQFTATTSCTICHGAGYTTTSNGGLLTHNNGTVNVASETTVPPARLAGPINWVAPVLSDTNAIIARGSCDPACHGRKSW